MFSTPAAGMDRDRTSPVKAPASRNPPSASARTAACAKPGILGPCAARAFFPPIAVNATMTSTRAPSLPSTLPNRCPTSFSSSGLRAASDSSINRRKARPRFHTGPVPRYAINDAVSASATSFVMGSGMTSSNSALPTVAVTIVRSAAGSISSWMTPATPSHTVSNAKKSAIIPRSIAPDMNPRPKRPRQASRASNPSQIRADSALPSPSTTPPAEASNTRRPDSPNDRSSRVSSTSRVTASRKASSSTSTGAGDVGVYTMNLPCPVSSVTPRDVAHPTVSSKATSQQAFMKPPDMTRPPTQ
ncbi:hypothetical protein COSO111634_37590 [Corallococcus soli]